MDSTLLIACQEKELPRVRRFVFDRLKGIRKIAASLRHHLVLAADEITTNLIVHAAHRGTNNEILFNMEVTEEKVVFVFRSRGKKFDINEYPDPSIEELIKRRKKGGMGLALVKNIVDVVECSFQQGVNTYKLIKYI